MGSAIFRADASVRLGMGHIMRCISFATHLNNLGIDSTFVVKNMESKIAEVISVHGFQVEHLPNGVTVEEESHITNVIAERITASLIITDVFIRPVSDHLARLRTFHSLLNSKYFRIGFTSSIVDNVATDLLICPYFGSVPNVLIPGAKPKWLIGPDYFIFRDEFVRAADQERQINDVCSKVLVTIGGSDELHITTKIANSVKLLETKPLHLYIVIGAGYTRRLKKEIVDCLKDYSSSYQLMENPSNIADLMMNADLAIIGDGLTKYEAAVTGTPSIMLSRFDSEHHQNSLFEQAGTTIHLGDAYTISTESLSESIKNVMVDFSLRVDMSIKGKSLVDGKGINRVINHIPPQVFL